MKDRRRALAVLVAVFLVGIVLGAAGSYFWLKPSDDAVKTFEDMRPPAPKGLVRPNFPELNLTPEQQEKHAEIYAETREKLKEIDAENRERMREQLTNLWKQEDAVWDEAYPKLIAVLNEEQKVEFDKFWVKARDYGQRLRRRRESEPPKENHRKPERPQSKPPE
jgi:Spy/CpxP family protein refolding chaperone